MNTKLTAKQMAMLEQVKAAGTLVLTDKGQAMRTLYKLQDAGLITLKVQTWTVGSTGRLQYEHRYTAKEAK